ncbi:alpha/beta fold hydrolase [Mycobacterium tuberculosis]
MSARRPTRSSGATQIPDVLPPSRTLTVRAADGTPLHTQVFGPPHGYPIVLTHGFVCAIRAWAYQIADLAGDYRVIAFDHRGHGRSGVPRRGAYSLNHLAADLDSVLDATLAPRERAVVAGHSTRRHYHCRLVGPLPPQSPPPHGRRRADQHHHRRPGAQGETAVGATRVVPGSGAGRPEPGQHVRRVSTPRRGQGLKPARDLHAGGRRRRGPQRHETGL